MRRRQHLNGGTANWSIGGKVGFADRLRRAAVLGEHVKLIGESNAFLLQSVRVLFV